MQACLKAVLLVCALAATTSSFGVGFCDYIGFRGKPCGCGNPNCCDGCEPNRWIDAGCGCEASCGCGSGCGDCCEPTCGCGAYCVDGRKFAGKTYNCNCDSYLPMCGCNGPECCEPTCGCGCGDCCEADCGCEPSCGCSSGGCCQPKASICGGFLGACGRMCSALCGGSSCGCSGEMYWSEWHNDPPRCCDPCNRCGQWVGPPAGGGGCGPNGCGCNGGVSSTFDGGYGGPSEYYSNNRPAGPHGGTTFAGNQKTIGSAPVARSSTTHGNGNPYAQGRVARKPQVGSKQQVQR